jgi:acylphosphatase
MAAPPASLVRVHVWVSGRVQGVGFRFFVLDRARALGLAGFVRNLPDRRVEVAAEGSPSDVNALVDVVRAGPPGAVVSGVELTWEPPAGETGFAVRTDRDA